VELLGQDVVKCPKDFVVNCRAGSWRASGPFTRLLDELSGEPEAKVGQISTVHSCATDVRQSVREFHDGVMRPDTELAVFFCSSEYDLDALASEIGRRFGAVPVVGCTTAGEIGPAGYRHHSLVGVGFPAGACGAVTGRLDHLTRFRLSDGQVFANSLLAQLERRVPSAAASNTFGFLLIDGMSMREEPVTRALQNTLGPVPMLGGSAGDDLRFKRAAVFHGGAFHSDSAVLILMSTVFPFRIFKTQHFDPLTERLVVTAADAAHRVVTEINGRPAAEEYARLIGVPADALGPDAFAASPVVVLIDGTDYVRSIQRVNPDHSLTFYSAIEEGLVLRVAKGVDLAKNLAQALAEVQEAIGPPQLVLACDCILRSLEMQKKGLQDTVAEIMRRAHAVGFSTYGEQYRGVHVNQTLTALAIGCSSEAFDV
jgi:hypothetical protein